MKFGTFVTDHGQSVCLLDTTKMRAWPLDDALDLSAEGMLDLIGRFDSLRGRISASGDGSSLDLSRLKAPIPRPRRNIFCVGKNYFDHAHEFTSSGFDAGSKSAADAVPEAPILFTKAPESVIGHGAEIACPASLGSKIDYEAELAVVIGKQGRGIRAADALDHVFGYTIINDVTARDLQAKHKQWFLGKSIDTFCPMGPWIVTADEVDAANMRVQCWVNGELRQNASTKDLIFTIPTLIETISASLTLYPGDIIATGTPAGVGIGFNPPRFLASGDVVAIEISGIGILENRLSIVSD